MVLVSLVTKWKFKNIILPARERIVNYSAGMENITENVADAEEDINLDQDIFVESSGSEDNYLGELENIKNQGIEGRLELSSAWSARLKTTL